LEHFGDARTIVSSFWFDCYAPILIRSSNRLGFSEGGEPQLNAAFLPLSWYVCFCRSPIGGEQVSNRVGSLGEASAGTVYYANRGTFLEDTIYRILPEYPLGAGLGRWGMVYQYFGDKSSASLPSLWAEIQPTACLYDGGAPLLLAYYAAMMACILQTLRVALYKSGVIADFATIVFALNIATLANIFSYAPFIGQSGLTFRLVNACFFAAEMRGSTSTLRRLKETTNGSGQSFARYDSVVRFKN